MKLVVRSRSILTLENVFVISYILFLYTIIVRKITIMSGGSAARGYWIFQRSRDHLSPIPNKNRFPPVQKCTNRWIKMKGFYRDVCRERFYDQIIVCDRVFCTEGGKFVTEMPYLLSDSEKYTFADLGIFYSVGTFVS